MQNKTIIVPVDGASNVKIEVFEFDSLERLFSMETSTPVRTLGGLDYNDAGAECGWFDEVIRELPDELRDAAVIAPVARGASGGLIGRDGSLCEVPGEGLALAYTQRYPERVDDRFRDLAGTAEDFFGETGSIRDFPGSLTLLKRLLFEEMERPDVLERSAGFAPLGIILSGHYLNGGLPAAWRAAGNEHSNWMCHTGARDIRSVPGTMSSAARKIPSFERLVPASTATAYRPIGVISPATAASLGLPADTLVTPGGHDTCISHIPVMSAFYGAFPGLRGKPVVQVEAGSWTMIARIGGDAVLPTDGWRRDILVQGTVDGGPVTTARYGGGYDFRHVRELIKHRGGVFTGGVDEHLLSRIASAADAFVLPNINPSNHGTGPFPDLRGRIVNEDFFFNTPGAAFMLVNLAVTLTAAEQVAAVAPDGSVPIVLTAGGAKDHWYGRLLATFTGSPVYALMDRRGNPVTETTALGAAMAGNAAVSGIHPYEIDLVPLGIVFNAVEPFGGPVARALEGYREQWRERVKGTEAQRR